MCTHRSVLYAQRFGGNIFSVFNYDETREYETKSDAPQHITQNKVDFNGGFCVIPDFIVTIRYDQPQLYFFSLKGDFVKSETMPILQNKYILDSYNEDSMLVRDYKKKELWVVKLNGEATKINIDSEDPVHPCVTGENLFVYCYKNKAIVKYV